MCRLFCVFSGDLQKRDLFSWCSKNCKLILFNYLHIKIFKTFLQFKTFFCCDFDTNTMCSDFTNKTKTSTHKKVTWKCLALIRGTLKIFFIRKPSYIYFKKQNTFGLFSVVPDGGGRGGLKALMCVWQRTFIGFILHRVRKRGFQLHTSWVYKIYAK